MVQQIFNSKLELMKIIWGNGRTVLYVQIGEALTDKGNDWQKNTIITLLSRLVDKGILKTDKFDYRSQYLAIVSESDYQAEQTKKLMEKLDEESKKGLVSTLIEKELLFFIEWEELRKFWKDNKSSL